MNWKRIKEALEIAFFIAAVALGFYVAYWITA